MVFLNFREGVHKNFEDKQKYREPWDTLPFREIAFLAILQESFLLQSSHSTIFIKKNMQVDENA